jgi:hypothetical protein
VLWPWARRDKNLAPRLRQDTFFLLFLNPVQKTGFGLNNVRHNRMRPTIILVAVALAGGGCTSTDNRSPEYWVKQLDEPVPPEASHPEEVSLIRLIASPHEFDGHYVRVLGYLHMEFERDAVFIRKEDCDQWLEINCVKIGVSRPEMKKKMEELSDRYVLLEGTFYYKKEDWNGTIWRVSRVEPNFTPKELIERMKETSPNQPPLRTPGSGTPASDAPVAPPPGAAGR